MLHVEMCQKSFLPSILKYSAVDAQEKISKELSVLLRQLQLLLGILPLLEH